MLQRFFFSRIAFFISCGFFSGNFFREGLNCGQILDLNPVIKAEVYDGFYESRI